MGWVSQLAIGVLGRGFDDVQLLEVPGRITGRRRSTPVKVIRLGGQRFLVSLTGESDWVLNLRASPVASLRLGRRRVPVQAAELPADERVPVLREYLRLASQARTPAILGVGSRDAPDAEIRRSAADHPVFRLDEPAGWPASKVS